MLDQQSPSLGQVLAAALDSRMVDVHTCLPARIESYDAATQSCSVQVELRQARFTEEGDRVPDRLPVINRVPVAFARGGGFRTTYPLVRGDRVWLVFCEGSLDRWKARGGDIDPGDDRRFHLSDAVALAGCADLGHPLKNAPTDRMSIGADAGPTIELTNDAIHVGGNPGTTQPPLKGTSYNSAVSTYVGALGVYLAAIVAGLPVPGAVAPATTTYNAAVLTFLNAATASLAEIAKVR